MTDTNPMAWLPHSIAEAALSEGGGADSDLPTAWAHLLERLETAGRTRRIKPGEPQPR